MAYWLMKTEPSTFSWDDLVRDGKTLWDGVRNHQAANAMRAMKKGDLVLIYHSVTDKTVVGVAKVTKEAFPDPTAKEGNWVVVEVRPVRAFPRPVTLVEVKATPALADMRLVKQSRLSVTPVTAKEWRVIERMSGRKSGS